MPRAPTITQSDVDKICQRLLEQGTTPTQRLIIAEHGSGSPNTVQPLLKDWKQRRRAETPADEAIALSPELLKALNKQFVHDVRVAQAELKDQLEASEEASGDLARENAAIQSLLQQREAELAVLSEQDAVVRGQAAQLENDLERLRRDYDLERQARLAAERQAAAAGAQRDASAGQLVEVQKRLAQTSEELTTLRVAAGSINAQLAAALQTAARQENELAQARNAEQAALQTAAELRGQLRAGTQ